MVPLHFSMSSIQSFSMTHRTTRFRNSNLINQHLFNKHLRIKRLNLRLTLGPSRNLYRPLHTSQLRRVIRNHSIRNIRNIKIMNNSGGRQKQYNRATSSTNRHRPIRPKRSSIRRRHICIINLRRLRHHNNNTDDPSLHSTKNTIRGVHRFHRHKKLIISHRRSRTVIVRQSPPLQASKYTS